MTNETRTLGTTQDGAQLEGVLAFDPAAGPRPVVLIFHSWVGRADNEVAVARRMAELGYAGFACDLYGKGVLGTNKEECAALMNPLMADRAGLQSRLLHWRSEEHTSELQSLMRISYAVFCLKKKQTLIVSDVHITH